MMSLDGLFEPIIMNGEGGTDERTDERMNERTNESPSVFYRTSFPSGPLPKKEERNRRILLIVQ